MLLPGVESRFLGLSSCCLVTTLTELSWLLFNMQYFGKDRIGDSAHVVHRIVSFHISDQTVFTAFYNLIIKANQMHFFSALFW